MRSNVRVALCLMLLSAGIWNLLRADEKPRLIEGWGEFFDPVSTSRVELDKGVLVMTAPDDYVDNFHTTAAPRVMQDVSDDFTFEVTVVHVDPAKPKSVLASLGSFPTAYHSGTLLVRSDDRNYVRFERVSSCRDQASSTCWLHIYQNGKPVHLNSFDIKDVPTRMALQRRGNSLLALFSQNDGKTWKEFEAADIAFLPKKMQAGVSMTSNTDPGCTVKFKDLKIITK